MRSLRALIGRLGGLAGGEDRDREFRAELESHLQMHIDDNLRAGMSATDARRHALIKLGGIEQTRERYRDRQGLPVVETAVKDLRFAMRLMRRDPALTGIILLTLALGIGANAVMFSVVNAVLLRPLPYDDPARLVSVQTAQAADRSLMLTSPPDFYVYREHNRTLSHLDAFYTRSMNLTGSADPERVPTLVASSGFFANLGIQPAFGRGFVFEDEEWGAHRVVVLSDGLWRRRFGADSRIIGRPVTLNGEPHVVIGVLAPAFSFMGLDVQLVAPMAFEPGDNLNSHSNYFLRMLGRLRADVTLEQAAGDLNRLSEAIIAEQSVNEGTVLAVSSLREALSGAVRRPVLVLLGAVAFVLLIACANLANLLLARGVVRQREVAVRLAMGATRARLVRQFLVESLSLSVAGGALGLSLAYASTNALNALSMQVLPRAQDIRVDPTVLSFTCAIAVVTGILLGLAPALHGVGADLVEGLKDSTRSASDSRGRHRLRAALVVAEVALSLVLLVGAGLMVKSMSQLLRIDPGFQADRVLTLQINLPAQKYVERSSIGRCRAISRDFLRFSIASSWETISGPSEFEFAAAARSRTMTRSRAPRWLS
ncbi:MAG: ABC transporter permease [Acidobacteria bacterium]|nr:ABC transporter permease [Acidobacteriota bacterium]